MEEVTLAIWSWGQGFGGRMGCQWGTKRASLLTPYLAVGVVEAQRWTKELVQVHSTQQGARTNTIWASVASQGCQGHPKASSSKGDSGDQQQLCQEFMRNAESQPDCEHQTCISWKTHWSVNNLKKKTWRLATSLLRMIHQIQQADSQRWIIWFLLYLLYSKGYFLSLQIEVGK